MYHQLVSAFIIFNTYNFPKLCFSTAVGLWFVNNRALKKAKGNLI